MVSHGYHTPQEAPWVIWAIGCGGWQPSGALKAARMPCIGDLPSFARCTFSLVCANGVTTDMPPGTPSCPRCPQVPPGAPWGWVGAGCPWSAAELTSGHSRAPQSAIWLLAPVASPVLIREGGWFFDYFGADSAKLPKQPLPGRRPDPIPRARPAIGPHV